MPQTVEDLGRLVKAKHPEYSDMSDIDVGQKVKAKYPNDYSDFMDIAAAPKTPGDVARSQITSFGESSGLAGLGRLLTHPVDTISAAASEAANHPLDTGIGLVKGAVMALPNAAAAIPAMVRPTIQNIAHDLPPQIRTSMGLPQSVPAATDEANLGGAAAGGTVAAAIPAVVGLGELGSKVASGVGDALSGREMSAKLWNAVANVKAGREGTQMDMATGKFKTLPGRSMVGDGGPISETVRAYLASPNAATQMEAYKGFQNAGEALGNHLAKSNVPIDIGEDLPLDNKKLMSALTETGSLPSSPTVDALLRGDPNVTTLKVTPTQANAVKSAIGDRINWNPAVLNDANEALKDAYFSITKKIGAAVPGIAPYLTDWQESFFFNKALKTTMEKAANNPPILPPIVKLGLKGAAATAGIGAIYEAGKQIVK